MSTDVIKMPNFRVDLRLNKLSSDWQFARAVLEDEYVGLDKTLNHFRTRYDFAQHLLDVHRMWCVRRAVALPSRCLAGRSDGETADAVQSKNYVSASTQTDTQSHFEERNPDSDLHIKQELVSEKLYDVHMESSMNESSSEERHKDEIPTLYSASDLHSYLENTNQVSDLLIKPEVVPHDHCGVRVERSTNESTNLLRNEEGLPMQHNRSEVDSRLEETDPLSDLLIKQEVVSQEIYDVHLDTTESTSHQGHGEGIATHNIGSGNLVDIYNEPSTSTMHHDVDSPELSSQDIGTADGKSILENKSRTLDNGNKYGPDSLSSYLHDTDRKSILVNDRRPSRTTHLESNDGKTILANDRRPSRTITHDESNGSPDTLSSGNSGNSNKDIQNSFRSERRKSFQCVLCSKIFFSLSVFHLHMKVHAEPKIRNQRRQVRDSNQSYRCSVCNKDFTTSSQLSLHLRTHTGEKPFECNYCSYRCSQKGNLIRHIRRHTGVKPFACNFCSYRSSDKSYLNVHVRRHLEQKLHQCSVCNKPFTTSRQLSNHMRTHT